MTTTVRTTTPTLEAALDLVVALEQATAAARRLDLDNVVGNYSTATALAASAAAELASDLYGPTGLYDAMTCQDTRTANLAHRAYCILGAAGVDVETI